MQPPVAAAAPVSQQLQLDKPTPTAAPGRAQEALAPETKGPHTVNAAQTAAALAASIRTVQGCCSEEQQMFKTKKQIQQGSVWLAQGASLKTMALQMGAGKMLLVRRS